MIDVDTNVLAPDAFLKDSEWNVPLLWRSEFRNVLAYYLRRADWAIEQAREVMHEAESLLEGNEYMVDSFSVLKLVDQSGCSAYDCEFVALAQDLGLPLVTCDGGILKAFPQKPPCLWNHARVCNGSASADCANR